MNNYDEIRKALQARAETATDDQTRLILLRAAQEVAELAWDLKRPNPNVMYALLPDVIDLWEKDARWTEVTTTAGNRVVLPRSTS